MLYDYCGTVQYPGTYIYCVQRTRYSVQYRRTVRNVRMTNIYLFAYIFQKVTGGGKF